MVFKEVEQNVFKFEKPGDSVTGILLQIREHVGPNDSRLYILQPKGEPKIGVWGTTVLDSKMAHVEVGDLIQIVYKGLNKLKKYHDFNVLKDDGTPEGESD